MRTLLGLAALACTIGTGATTVVAGPDAERDARLTDFCPRTRYRGTALDLDVKGADVHEVFRLLADVGRVNLVVPEDVTGKVTLRLKRAPWDNILCTVAATQRLRVQTDGSILVVSRRS